LRGLHVVVRVPWKRPKEDVKWTPEKDNILWTYLIMYQSSNMNWDLIAGRLNMPADECIKRASYLYQQQLHLLQQKRYTSLTKQSPQQNVRPSGDSNPGIRPTATAVTSRSSPSHSPSTSPIQILPAQHSPSPQHDQKIDPEALRECVQRHDFEWATIGRELGMNPRECRKLYFALQEYANPSTYSISTPISIPAPTSSSFAASSSHFDMKPNTLPILPAPAISLSTVAVPTPLAQLVSIPAFLQDDYKEDIGDSSSGELFSDSSVTRSALESAIISDPKILEQQF
jgi:hypothetical protein